MTRVGWLVYGCIIAAMIVIGGFLSEYSSHQIRYENCIASFSKELTIENRRHCQRITGASVSPIWVEGMRVIIEEQNND